MKYGNLLKNNKVIVQNFFSLSALNVINIIFPLVLIPFLTQVLGAVSYGQYAYAFSIYSIGLIFVNFGFQFSGTKYISQNRESQDKIKRAIYSMTVIRIIISVLVYLSLIVLSFIITGLKDIQLLILSGFGILLGTALNPIWLYQGIEKMKYITIINTIPKLLSLLLIILFVKQSEDLYLVILFQGIGFFIAGILSISFAVKRFAYGFYWPKSSDIVYFIKIGSKLFLSSMSTNVYKELNTVILANLVSFQYVGYYAAAEKIVKAVRSFINPMTQTLYPHFAKDTHMVNWKKNFFQFAKLLWGVLSITTMVLILIPGSVYSYYLGESFADSVIHVKIMSLAILFGGMNYYYGMVGLVNMGKENDFLKSVFVVSIFSIVLCILLVKLIGVLGASITFVSSELVLFILLFYFFRKKTLNA